MQQQIILYIRRNKVNAAILLFLILFFIYHSIKPSITYGNKGEFRPFGVGYKNKTVVPMWLVAIILAILSYIAVAML